MHPFPSLIVDLQSAQRTLLKLLDVPDAVADGGIGMRRSPQDPKVTVLWKRKTPSDIRRNISRQWRVMQS